MPANIAERRRIFRDLHESGCFVIPNPWDAGSARYLQHLGFKALATTSSGCAWALGLPDNAVGLEAMLAHLGAIVRATTLAVERIKAARRAIDRTKSGVVLTARAECFLVGHPDPLNESVRRLQAYAAAGADCLYAPGVKTPEQIAAVVKAVAPKPVNLLIGGPGLSRAQAEALGVRRISVGGSLARVAWAGFMRAAKEMAEQGTFAELAGGYSGGELNKLFGQS